MAYDTILLRYSEIFLKGKNRPVFEHKLIDNMRKIVVNAGFPRPAIKKSQGRLLTEYFTQHSLLRQVFGLVTYSPAVHVEKNLEKIQEKAVELLRDRSGTFKVATKRSDKSFPHTSPECNRLIGEYIEKETELMFSLDKPDIVLEIEINQEGAYLFFETITCGGGLPTGVEGKILLLIEYEADLLAGLLFMKRGCSIIPIAFKEKDISLLQNFSPVELRLEIVKNIQELEELAARQNISILVSGQTLGGVTKWDTELTLMKPLIAYSKKQIEEKLKFYRSLISN